MAEQVNASQTAAEVWTSSIGPWPISHGAMPSRFCNSAIVKGTAVALVLAGITRERALCVQTLLEAGMLDAAELLLQRNQ